MGASSDAPIIYKEKWLNKMVDLVKIDNGHIKL